MAASLYDFLQRGGNYLNFSCHVTSTMQNVWEGTIEMSENFLALFPAVADSGQSQLSACKELQDVGRLLRASCSLIECTIETENVCS